MLQREVFPHYRKCVEELNKAYSLFQSMYNDTYVDELCEFRGYVDVDQRNLIQEMKLGYCEIEDVDLLKEFPEDLHLLSKNDNFLLNGRFIIPVYGVNGDLISLIGYYPDKRKYITLATPYFSKRCQFFNFKQAYETSFRDYNGMVILVEGIFDCLSLRSIGLPAIATMGSTVSPIKGELLKLFKKVLAVPDDDPVGRRSLNRYSKFGWKVPYGTTFIRFHGGLYQVGATNLHCKDMDNLVSWYDADDIREMFMDFYDCKEEIIDLKL
jgi:DNA primase